MKDQAYAASAFDLPCRVTLGQSGLKVTELDQAAPKAGWQKIAAGEIYAPAENELILMREETADGDRLVELDLREGGALHGPAEFNIYRPWVRCTHGPWTDPEPRLSFGWRLTSIIVGLALFAFCAAAHVSQGPAEMSAQTWQLAGALAFLGGAAFTFMVPKI